MATYMIGQAAGLSGFSTSALRFYEAHGLLEPAARTKAGYRLYDEASLQRLQFIGRAKQLGCTLAEITELAELWERAECGPVQARLHDLVRARIDDSERRGADLLGFAAQLRAAAALLEDEPDHEPCSDHCACLDAAAVADGVSSAAHEEGNDAPIVCTLPPEELPGRMDAWRRVMVHVTARERRSDGGLRLSLAPSLPLEEVARLVTAEQACCAFFGFSITVDGRGTALEVSAPSGASEAVEAVFADPTAQADATRS